MSTPAPHRPLRIAVLCDAFPELTETFVVNEVRALQAAGHEVRVVALGRPRRDHWPPGSPRPSVTYLGEVSRPRKLRAALVLAAGAPRACLRDRRDRSGWRPAEQPRRLAALAPVACELRRWGADHLHVHFAAGAAMEGLRLGAVLGVPVSVTAHAYDIFLAPRNLERKLARAAFVTTGCAYNVAHLRSLVDRATAARIHEIVMGVDAAAFTRTTPHPGDGHVVAVGRLVPKKGFADLVRACGLLREHPSFTGLTIVGEGPLEHGLTELAAELNLRDRVRFEGALPPDAVRAWLEVAAVLAMPCVVAPDGDRDSMPVVVKEALAMEIPVVGTDAVGLPEIVDDTCGRLVPPGDPAALAAALRELLDFDAAGRAALGRAGRARVLSRADVRTETDKLLGLIHGASRRPDRS